MLRNALTSLMIVTPIVALVSFACTYIGLRRGDRLGTQKAALGWALLTAAQAVIIVAAAIVAIAIRQNIASDVFGFVAMPGILLGGCLIAVFGSRAAAPRLMRWLGA